MTSLTEPAAPAGAEAAAKPRSTIPSYLREPPKRRLGMPYWGWSLIVFALIGVFFELIGRFGGFSRGSVIPASEWFVNAGRLLITGEFWTGAILPSLAEILIAFAIAAIAGLGLGYVIWRIRPLRVAVDPYLTAYYALPVFALYPIMMVIFRQGPLPITILATVFSIVAVIMNAMNGFDATPAVIRKLARSMQVSEWTYFTKFFVPYAMPYILIGLRLAFLYALLSVLAAEFLLGAEGLGFFVNNAYVRFQPGDMFGAVLVILALAIGAERLITLAVRKLTWVGSLA
jgi:NitT/TauT family transport system permease protein